jgi:hypothetical protein
MAMTAGPRLKTPTMAVPSVAVLVQQAASASEIRVAERLRFPVDGLVVGQRDAAERDRQAPAPRSHRVRIPGTSTAGKAFSRQEE